MPTQTLLLRKSLSALILPSTSQAQLKDIQAIVILGGGKNNNAPEYGGIDTVSSAK